MESNAKNNAKKKAFVLGGTVPHIDLIKILKKMDYYTILIDYTENPPAACESDIHIRESTLDKDKVLKLAIEYRIDLIISTCIDQANSTACYVAEKMGLPQPYSYETSIKVTRKDLMKHVFKTNGIPTSDYEIYDSDQTISQEIVYPAVIKPVDSNSSKGVFKINSTVECNEKKEISMEYSRAKKIIIEQYIEGTEIQVDCIAIDKKAYVLMTRDKETLSQDGKELQVSGFTIPGEVCTKNRNELELIAQKIVDAFDLITTPFFFQAICNANGVYVLEFAPRIAGGTTYKTVEMYSGVNYLQASVDCFLGRHIDINLKQCNLIFATKFLYMKPGTYSYVDGVKEAIDNNLIEEYFPFVTKGKVISDSFNSGNRIGAVLVKGKDETQLYDRLRKIMEIIRVIDDENRDLSYWRV